MPESLQHLTASTSSPHDIPAAGDMAAANAHKAHPLSHKLLFWGGLAAVGIVIAPHILPLMGVGELLAEDSLSACFPTTGDGTGLAGGVADLFKNYVPVIGEELAKGGWATALTSSAIGIGGVLLGNFMNKKEDGTHSIKWGTVIKYAALATSLLVSLPALLPALSAGISFLGGLALEGASKLGIIANANLAGTIETFKNAVTGFFGTLPGTGAAVTGGVSSLSALWPHILTCGGVVGSLNFAAKKAIINDSVTQIAGTTGLGAAAGGIISGISGVDIPLAQVNESTHQARLSSTYSAQKHTPFPPTTQTHKPSLMQAENWREQLQQKTADLTAVVR